MTLPEIWPPSRHTPPTQITSSEFTGVEVRDGQTTMIEVTMSVAPVTEDLINTGQSPIIDTSATQTAESIS